MKKLNERGFTLIEGSLIIIALAIVGGVGFYVVNANKSEKKPVPATQHSSNTDKAVIQDTPNTRSLSLAEGKVTLAIANNWSNDGTGCVKQAPAYEMFDYVDSTEILPGEKLPTLYGNGTEYFTIRVCVFNNPKNLSAKELLEQSSGFSSSKDETSDMPINGNEAYYFKQNTDDYQNVDYLIKGSSGKFVFVTARTYEPGKTKDGSVVGDFRKFESQIKDMVSTISIK